MIRKVEIIMEEKQKALIDFATKSKEECEMLKQHIVRIRFVSIMNNHRIQQNLKMNTLTGIFLYLLYFLFDISQIKILILIIIIILIFTFIACFIRAIIGKNEIEFSCKQYIQEADNFIHKYSSVISVNEMYKDVAEMEKEYNMLKNNYKNVKECFEIKLG